MLVCGKEVFLRPTGEVFIHPLETGSSLGFIDRPFVHSITVWAAITVFWNELTHEFSRKNLLHRMVDVMSPFSINACNLFQIFAFHLPYTLIKTSSV